MCGAHDFNNFGWPSKFCHTGEFWTDIPDKDTFEKILNYVNNISSEKWNKILNKHNIKNIITLDKKNKKILKTVQKRYFKFLHFLFFAQINNKSDILFWSIIL